MGVVLSFHPGNALYTERAEDAAAGDDAQWSQWMRQAQAGDRATYQRLLQSIVPYLSAIARRHFGPYDGIEDAVQDVLLIVHRVRHTYEPERPFKPWLATIASRHCIDMAQRARRRRTREGADPALLDAQPDGEPTPQEALERMQSDRAFRDTVAALPARQRTAVELVKLRGLSLQEASDASGLSIASLKVAVHRAVHSLRRQFERDVP